MPAVAGQPSGTRLHADEVPIDSDLVRRLLQRQRPEFAGLELRPAPSQGTDNLVFTLGDELAVRLPRKAEAVPSLLVEREWLPRLAPELVLAAPVPVATGEPDEAYPFPWNVCRWLPGESVGPDDLTTADAERLAEFVLGLQSLATDGGPAVEPGRRAGPVADYDARFRTALAAFVDAVTAGLIGPDELDPAAAERVWRDALDAPEWTGPGVWLHRDLMPANLLVAAGRLSAVIDFGGLAVGDPAGDLMALFHVVAPADRTDFAAAVGADEACVARARGWAMVQGIEAWTYYLNTHRGMVAMARRVLRATLGDH